MHWNIRFEKFFSNKMIKSIFLKQNLDEYFVLPKTFRIDIVN